MSFLVVVDVCVDENAAAAAKAERGPGGDGWDLVSETSDVSFTRIVKREGVSDMVLDPPGALSEPIVLVWRKSV